MSAAGIGKITANVQVARSLKVMLALQVIWVPAETGHDQSVESIFSRTIA